MNRVAEFLNDSVRKATVPTWVLVAHRSGARIFETEAGGRNPRLVQELLHPEGRLRDGELDTDRNGVSYSSSGSGDRHVMNNDSRASEHQAEDFARELASLLDQARSQNRYENLVLVAEPRFLGRLRSSLSDQTSKKVLGSVRKDLLDLSEHEIKSELTGMIQDLMPRVA